MQSKKRILDIKPKKRDGIPVPIKREEAIAKEIQQEPILIIEKEPIPEPVVKSYEKETEISPQKPEDEKTSSTSSTIKRVSSLLALTTVIVIAAMTVQVMNLNKEVKATKPIIAEKFKEAQNALINLDAGKAKTSFEEVLGEINNLDNHAEGSGALALFKFSGPIIPKLKSIPKVFKSLLETGNAAVGVATALEAMQQNAVRWLTTQQGSEFIKNIRDLENNITTAVDSTRFMATELAILGEVPDQNLVSFQIKSEEHIQVLDAFASWLERADEKRLLVFFQNPSELRPAGGFLGSYAELHLNRNGLQEIKTWDVYDPDGQLDINVIPPKELQSLTERWGARDANWFFDFPASARKIISFLELSKIYREQHAVFDGAISINVNVVSTILEKIGPIELPEYKLTINSENFLSELQREVEAGNDKKQGEPKRILKKLTPILFEKISTLSEDNKKSLLKMLKGHIEHKDIMIYFEDAKIEQYLKNNGLAGNVAELPQNFNGEYLAVVSANIAGGKSDAFTRTKINLSSKIGSDGNIDNFLTLNRTHEGIGKTDPWYKTDNKSYVSIFTPKGSKLTYTKGTETRIIKPSVDYENTKSYIKDSDLEVIESTSKEILGWNAWEREESDKTVFGTWFTTKAGKSGSLEMQYENPIKIHLGPDTIPYTFVFERQSGASIELDALFEAPEGYTWKENGEKIINYLDENPPSKTVVNLTLEKDHLKVLR
ncbi:MAG: hypothetical protein COU07_02500 [Candidatus Harrisonbacteria bacterium CG10_big_fil_rev_8_21_14_0_10_40_38]|uniref:DUF4012 domain-containing protein n=1 Tax=Candidatus Harrisonbacteria bacterium CG10_big_fil_rev_8_21_14_0_10_40_38 TaxID=1974583 RepID=A0A2H0URZ1_9BACT|nr:MAG: hypothetical protein COU07_02500 [Candidatus Harrisonbacteria bacterium CG10_big_fil_rev_8_21_14_0_10_40_38]